MTLLQIIFWDLVKLGVVMLGFLYAGLVLAGYITEGPRFQPRLNLSAPARSGERLLIWTGIKILDWACRIARSTLDELFTASAEVASWCVDKSSPAVQRKVRSRFI